MRFTKEKESVKVIPQLTFNPKVVSLVAEEAHDPYKKGDLVMQIDRQKLSLMERPFRVRIIRTKVKDGVRIGTRIVKSSAELH